MFFLLYGGNLNLARSEILDMTEEERAWWVARLARENKEQAKKAKG